MRYLLRPRRLSLPSPPPLWPRSPGTARRARFARRSGSTR